MSDYGEISSLISRTAMMVDHREYEEDVLKYYVEDMTMITTLASGERRELNGAHEVAGLIKATYTPPRQACTHVVANPIIDIDGDEARVNYYTILTLWGPGPQTVGLNEYDLKVRRCADGKWRIAYSNIVQKFDWMPLDQMATPASV